MRLPVDPGAGRFLSEDPVGFSGGNDFYSYVSNSPLSLIDPSGNAPCLDIDKFARTLDHNAGPPYGSGHCGRYVGWALAAGGANTGSHDGKDYGPYLLDAGFSEVSPDGYQPQAGDVAVIQPYTGGNHAGHVEGFDGTNWVSDYSQTLPRRGSTLVRSMHAMRLLTLSTDRRLVQRQPRNRASFSERSRGYVACFNEDLAGVQGVI